MSISKADKHRISELLNEISTSQCSNVGRKNVEKIRKIIFRDESLISTAMKFIQELRGGQSFKTCQLTRYLEKTYYVEQLAASPNQFATRRRISGNAASALTKLEKKLVVGRNPSQYGKWYRI